MEKNQILEMCKMRLDGYSLAEIADRFCVSREYVRQCTPQCKNDGSPRFRTNKNYIYPAILSYMRTNRISTKSLSEKSGIAYPTLSKYLTGTTNPPKPAIDKILHVTGMTYEEAFRTE